MCRLEETCRLLREVVIQTKVYKKKFGLVCEARPGDAPMDQELVQEMSCFYKNKLFEHFHRWVHLGNGERFTSMSGCLQETERHGGAPLREDQLAQPGLRQLHDDRDGGEGQPAGPQV